ALTDALTAVGQAGGDTNKDVGLLEEGMVHWKLLVLCLALMAIDPWIPSGRLRFYSTASGTLLLGAGALWWYLGWSTPKVDEGTRSTPMNLGVRRSVHFAEQPRSADLLLHEHAGLPPLESLSGPIDVGHIPPGAPPVPSTEQQAGVLTAANEMLPTAELAAGSRIRLISVSPYVSLAGQAGVIETTNSGKCNIKLDTGLGLKDVPFTALVRETGVEETAVAAMGASTVFAPYATTGHTTKLQAQASRLKDALTKAAALNSTVPSEGTKGPPRTEELKKQLQEIETLGGPLHGSGGTFARVADVGVGENPEAMSWHLKLPADLQRAAPEMYRNIRADGAVSARAWVNEQHPTPELKQSPAYQDLFTAATIIDFELAECKTEGAIMHKLATSDTLEIHLRKLAAYVYLKRTKDRTGANRMLGVRGLAMLENLEAVAKERKAEENQVGADGLPPSPAQHEQANAASQLEAEDVGEAAEFIEQLKQWALLPLPLPDRPEWKQRKSARLRLRQKRRLEVWRLASKLIRTINLLDRGSTSTSQLTSPATGLGRQVKATDVRSIAVLRLTRECAVLARARRGLGLTGVQHSAAVASLLKQPMDELGYMKFSAVKQVPLEAEKIVEPKEKGHIDMLAALPPEDATFYACEENVVDRAGKCELFFKDAEVRFGFVGGSEAEYIKYLSREDVQHLWEWDLMSNIRAIAGVSAVPKKNPMQQRKLIMQVASNYMFSDPSCRAHLGMFGGAALSRCFVPSDHLGIALCDEDSAFTFVKVPEWMTRWQGGPPVKAAQVWGLLRKELKDKILDPASTFVSPRYLRLAMGGSHSVYILMRINMQHIGRSMLNYVNRLPLGDSSEHVHGTEQLVEEEQVEMIGDQEWEKRQKQRKQLCQVSSSGFTVQEWCQAVRESQHGEQRMFVVMHFFAGDRRPGDVQEHLTRMCALHGLKLLMISIDLASDANWDYTNPETFNSVVLGGPPRSTVSRARHVKKRGGPRTLDGLKGLDGIRCPGVSKDHVHGISIERMASGAFHTRRLQEYPPKLCEAMADMVLQTLLRMRAGSTGPTGALHLREHVAVPRIPAWSTWAAQRGRGIVILNEASSRRQNVILDNKQSAVYVHVDDTVILSDGSMGPMFSDLILKEVVDGLEKVGFSVSQQERDKEVEKVVGYEVCRCPATFMLPKKKMVLLTEALKYVASCRKVNTRVLRALVGVWIFGALLRRELLSVPHSIFHFMEEHENMTVVWWQSAREEAIAMARLTCLMSCHVGAKLHSWIFATDAMGANEFDHGGYGIVTTKAMEKELAELVRSSETQGRVIAQLGSLGGSKYPHKPLCPTVPFTLLPASLFAQERWHLVEAGRWAFNDHITLGESRTVLLRVKEETLLGYQKHLTPFLAFLQNRWELAVLSAEDVDLLMLEYRTEFDITRSQHTQLVASMEFFMPHVKGKLLLNREAIKGRIAGAPIQHTVPLTRECAFLFAAWHSSRGFPRLGAAVLIQMNTGLRPSEMLSLVREHVYIPLNPREAISVRLGAVYSTKVKREQFVLVQPSQSPFEYKLIKLLHAATLPNNKLFPFSYAAYNNSFGLAEKHFGLDLHLTAHSGRAGFATSRIMSGAEAKQVQAEGRWASESSFRTYIDVVGSLHTRAQVELGRPDLRLKENRFLIPQAPEHYTGYQRRQWREEQLQKLLSPQPAADKGSAPKVSQTQPKAKGVERAEASSWRLGGRRSRFSISSWCKWISPVLKKISGLSLLLCLGLFSGQHGPVHQVARVIGAVADLGEATSAAAVSALNATNALASSATALVTVATSNGLTAGANMWHGIDLADIQAGRCAGSITALSGPVLEAWLHTTAAQAHFPCLDGNLTERLIAAVQAVEASLPSTQAISEDFSLRGTFTSLRIMATWQDFGQVSIQFEASFLFFTPIWSNPLWTQWGCKLDSERDQILKALRLLLLDLPATPPQRAYAGLDLEVALSAPTEAGEKGEKFEDAAVFFSLNL
ncbi:unnamed protein product, partial [Cladocopium goreaui]